MSDISNRSVAETMRYMAWKRAKGELRSVLHTYWPIYQTDGKEKDQGFGPVNKKIEQFIEDVDDLLL
jgi:hypothetical protein